MEGFRWTVETGMVGLGDLPGGNHFSSANGISADGSVIVGDSQIERAGLPSEAFRWTAESGLIPLSQADHGIFMLGADAVSSDGNIILGSGIVDPTGPNPEEGPMLWTLLDGPRLLRDILVNDYGLGPQITGWSLDQATDISADGRTIVGYGVNPRGETEAWLVRLTPIPEPASVLIAFITMLSAGIHYALRARPS
jgi:uncharacterized membrane protein